MTPQVLTVRLQPRWTSPCKFCRRPVTFRKQLDGALVKFDADPTPLRTYRDRATGIPCEDVDVDQLHWPRCPGVEHTLFDDVQEAH